MATLADIRQKVRNITGRPDPTQLSNAQIDFYVNNYYTLNFPDEFRTLDLKQYLEIVLQTNVDTYSLPPQTGSANPTVLYPVEIDKTGWVGGQQISVREDPQTFYQIWPETANIKTTFAVGDGGVAYTGTLNTTPIVPGTVVISDGVQGLTDINKDGNLYELTSANIYGTVNYITGAVSVIFPNIVNIGTTIYGENATYTSGQPVDALFYEQQFIFRPVPDKPYLFKIQVYVRPTELASNNPNAMPNFIEWWELIAMGASLKVFEDNGDMDQYQKFYPLYQNYKDIAQRRTLKQIATERAQTLYADTGNYAWGPWSNTTTS